ncbi:MAG: hypothetical protein ABIH53_00235 [archaeon]
MIMISPKFLIPVIFLLLISYVSAEEITTSQQEYWLGETVQAEVTMNNFDLSKLSLQDNQTNKILVGFLALKLDGKTFVSFNIPTNLDHGDYYLTAKDQRIIEDVLQDFELSTKITIANELGVSVDPAIFTIKPSEDEFKIALHNYAADTVTVNITTSHKSLKPVRDSLEINPGETKNAFVKYTGLDSEQSISLTYLNRTYTIKIVLPTETTTEPETPQPITTEPATTGELKFEGQGLVEKQASKYTSFSDPLTIKSTINKEIHNLKFSLTGNLAEVTELKVQEIQTLAITGSIEQFVWVNKDKTAAPGLYEGDIEVSSDEGYSDTIHLKITLTEPILIEEPIQEPTERLFNQSKLSLLINETNVQEEPNITQNITIAIAMLVIMLTIFTFIALKMRNKTLRKRFEDYVSSFKKGRK